MTAASADLTRLASDLRLAGLSATAAAGAVVSATAQQVQALAQQKAPFKTGRLRESITVSQPAPNRAVIGPTVEYGAYQEFGTASRGEFGGSPYVILPKRAPRLVFTIDGKRIHAKKVVHPGVRARPYMRPALVEALGTAARTLAEDGQLLITVGPKAVA